MAKRHYQTMKTEDICRLPIRDIATDDALCFMWSTFPNIDQALAVMAAWGFQYKTAAFVWIKKYQKSNKNFMGMGAYTRANAEVCLLGISSKTKAKECVRSHAVQQVIEAPIEKHSKSRILCETGLSNYAEMCRRSSFLPGKRSRVGIAGEMRWSEWRS